MKNLQCILLLMLAFIIQTTTFGQVSHSISFSQNDVQYSKHYNSPQLKNRIYMLLRTYQ